MASGKLLTRKETGKRKGFGFIEMPVYDQTKAAIAALNGKEIYGRNIALSEGLEKQQEVERPAFSNGHAENFRAGMNATIAAKKLTVTDGSYLLGLD